MIEQSSKKITDYSTDNTDPESENLDYEFLYMSYRKGLLICFTLNLKEYTSSKIYTYIYSIFFYLPS